MNRNANFFVALISPDIPQNTGNIARLCAATRCELVLVRPLGFRLTDHHLARAGMDYWDRIQPIILDSLSDFFEWSGKKRVFLFTSKGQKSLFDDHFLPGDVFCFGAETSGLPSDVMVQEGPNRTLLRIPMEAEIRCLNVSSSAAVAVYEGLRQIKNWGIPRLG